jgi:hypothetical protein
MSSQPRFEIDGRFNTTTFISAIQLRKWQSSRHAVFDALQETIPNLFSHGVEMVGSLKVS